MFPFDLPVLSSFDLDVNLLLRLDTVLGLLVCLRVPR